MRRHPTAYTSSFSAGPGPLSTAIKAIIVANVVLFFASAFSRTVIDELGLVPYLFLHELRLWQPVTYMFVHAGIFHILFNMLGLWLIGTELERIWGTQYFVKFYFVTGIGAGLLTVAFALLPFGFARQVYGSNIIGASGAIYGLLLAYALYFPDRPIYMYFLFPIPAKYFVLILGRDRLLLVAWNHGRGGQRHASRRPRCRLRIPQGYPDSSDLRAEVPLSEMEDQPCAPQVRCARRRPRRRLGPSDPLAGVLGSSFAFGRRCIPSRGVARRSHTPGYSPSLAPCGAGASAPSVADF